MPTNDAQPRESIPLARAYLLGTFVLEQYVVAGNRMKTGSVYQEISSEQWGPRKQVQRLFMVLLARPGRRARKSFLMDLFWPETDAEQASIYLNQTVSKLRIVLRLVPGGETLLVTESAGYALAPQERLWVDADAAEALLQQAKKEGAEPFSLVAQALHLLKRGTFLEEEEGIWALGRRGRLEELLQSSQLWFGQLLAQQGKLEEAETFLRDLLEEEPADEEVLCALMRLLYEQGKSQRALRIYAMSKRLLKKEGMPLSASTNALAQSIRTHYVTPDNTKVEAENEIKNPSLTSLPQVILQERVEAVYEREETANSNVSYVSSPSGVLIPFFSGIQEALPENGIADDCVTWFSERLASIVAFVHQWQRQGSCIDFEKLLDRELRAFDEIKMMFDPDAYSLSRRSTLVVIATLPKGLLGVLRQQNTAFIEGEFLPACAASITACWYLLNGREFASVERALSRYVPFLVGWARQVSPYQRTAAYLASQACLLLGFIELHRLQFQRRIIYCKEAVKHGREAGVYPLLVKALTQLGNAYYDQGMHEEMLRAYQEAMYFMKDVPHSLQSKVLMGLAHAYAQQGQAAEALDTISQARGIFPPDIEDVPAFLSADDGEYSLILFEGWIRLDLGKCYPDKDYNKQAAKALAQIESLSTTRLIPERYRHEIINRRAQAAIELGELDEFCDFTLQSAKVLQMMQSEKRRQELIINYKTALKKWSQESKIVELSDIVL